MYKTTGVQNFTSKPFHFKKSFIASYFLPTGPANPYSKGACKKTFITFKYSSSSKITILDNGFFTSSSISSSSIES